MYIKYTNIGRPMMKRLNHHFISSVFIIYLLGTIGSANAGISWSDNFDDENLNDWYVGGKVIQPPVEILEKLRIGPGWAVAFILEEDADFGPHLPPFPGAKRHIGLVLPLVVAGAGRVDGLAILYPVQLILQVRVPGEPIDGPQVIYRVKGVHLRRLSDARSDCRACHKRRHLHVPGQGHVVVDIEIV